MSSQHYFIRSVEALTSLLVVNADSARIRQQSNREKAHLLRRMTSATHFYFSALSDESVLASDANLDLTIALLDKVDAATAHSTTALHRLTSHFDTAHRRRFHASTVLALSRVIDTMDFDQAMRMVSWIGDDTITTEKTPSLPELPSLLDRLAQRCLKANDLRGLAKVYDADDALRIKALPSQFSSERYRDFVPRISDQMLATTLAHVTRRLWASAETKELGEWVRVLRKAVNHSSLQDFAEAHDTLDQLDITLTDLKRGPILATLDAAAARLRAATAPTLPKAKTARTTRGAKIGDPK